MNIEQRLEQTFNALKKTLGWTVDKRITLSLAGYYVTLEKEFDETKYKEVASHLKKEQASFRPYAHTYILFL